MTSRSRSSPSLEIVDPAVHAEVLRRAPRRPRRPSEATFRTWRTTLSSHSRSSARSSGQRVEFARCSSAVRASAAASGPPGRAAGRPPPRRRRRSRNDRPPGCASPSARRRRIAARRGSWRPAAGPGWRRCGGRTVRRGRGRRSRWPARGCRSSRSRQIGPLLAPAGGRSRGRRPPFGGPGAVLLEQRCEVLHEGPPVTRSAAARRGGRRGMRRRAGIRRAACSPWCTGRWEKPRACGEAASPALTSDRKLSAIERFLPAFAARLSALRASLARGALPVPGSCRYSPRAGAAVQASLRSPRARSSRLATGPPRAHRDDDAGARGRRLHELERPGRRALTKQPAAASSTTG